MAERGGIARHIKRLIHNATAETSQRPPVTPGQIQETIEGLGLLSKRHEAGAAIEQVKDLIQTPGAFGLTQDTAQTMLYVLEQVQTKPTLSPLITEGVLVALEIEKDFAIPDYEALLKQQATRRRVLQAGAIGAGALVVAGAGALWYYKENNSPEAIEEERQRRLLFEKTGVLGTAFSVETPEGWRMRHPEASDTRYKEIMADIIDTYNYTSASIKWRDGKHPNGSEKWRTTQIKVESYEDSDWRYRPLLAVLTGGTMNSGTWQRWLPSGPNPNLDHRIIELKHKSGEQRAIINPNPDNKSWDTPITTLPLIFVEPAA